MSLFSMDFAENPIRMFMVLSRGCWVSVYLFMLGQAGSDLAVSGSSSPEVEYGNMEQLSAVQTNQGSSGNNVVNTSVYIH